MYITRFRVGNYKSFVDSSDLDLGPGFNVICGQNNAGKTSLIEALDPNINPSPHRSLSTVPTPRTQPELNSWVQISYSLEHADLLEILREQGRQQYILPWPAPGGPFSESNQSQAEIKRLVERVLSQEQFVFRLLREFGPSTSAWKPQALPSFGSYPVQQNSFVHFIFNTDGSLSDFGALNQQVQTDIGLQLTGAFQTRVYRFNAERLNVGVCNFGTNSRLAQNASNLAEVLNILQGNTPKFRYFNSLVHEVFPQIHQVSVTPPAHVQGQVEIRVWTLDPTLHDRVDLAMPLAQSGTGIGQVLAILYVAFFSTSPQVLIIDEPQSFLHPGAIRKLVQVLKVQSKHQFIVATHSPTVISAAEPTTITICRLADGVSKLERVDPKDANDLQSYLVEVGARLSDVFGADNILWVEGRTEERCFPMVLERIGQKRLRGTAILAVSNTGDLQTRDAVRVFEMYNRLSQTNSLLPPAVGFIFDSECRSSTDKDELRRRSRDLLEFLPRRMYENYLLHPTAIAAVANGITGFRDPAVTEDEVAALLAEMERRSLYMCPSTAEIAKHRWNASTDAALVLQEIFNKLSETRVAFDKADHAVRLTEWLIANAPEELREVSDLILSCLPNGPEIPAP